MDQNFAALEQINMLSRQLAIRVNELEKTVKPELASNHTRLLAIEQRLSRLEESVKLVPERATLTSDPQPAPMARAVPRRPGAPVRAPTPLGAVEATPPEEPARLSTAFALIDGLRELIGAMSTPPSKASDGAAPADVVTETEEPDWMTVEGVATPPVADVVTTHVDH